VLTTRGIHPASRGASTTWRQFLRRQAAGIVARGVFSLDTVSHEEMSPPLWVWLATVAGLGGLLAAEIVLHRRGALQGLRPALVALYVNLQ